MKTVNETSAICKRDFTLGGISALRETISKRHRNDPAYQV